MEYALKQSRFMFEDIQYGLGIVLHHEDTESPDNQGTEDQHLNINHVQNFNISNIEYQQLMEIFLVKMSNDIDSRLLLSVLISALLVMLSVFVFVKHQQYKYRLPEGFERQACSTEMERALIEKLWNAQMSVVAINEQMEADSVETKELREHVSLVSASLSKMTARARHLEEENNKLFMVGRQQELLLEWYKTAYLRRKTEPPSLNNILPLSEQPEIDIAGLKHDHMRKIVPSIEVCKRSVMIQEDQGRLLENLSSAHGEV